MKAIFSSSVLWSAYRALTRAARGVAPCQPYPVGVVPLMEAAVKFTTQLAIDVADRDLGEMRSLERTLITTLATWYDEGGDLTLRLWTHDISSVLGELGRSAHCYAAPPRVMEAAVKEVVVALPRNLAVAAVAFTTQLAIEETACDVSEMRALERAMISVLEAPWDPWEIRAFPLSVDVEFGPTWEACSKVT